MQGVDYVIIVAIGLAAVLGTVRGFIREIVALCSWLVAIWVAWRFSGFLHPYLGGVLEFPEQKAWLARGLVLLAVLLLGAAVGALLTWLTATAAGISVFSRILGFVVGLLRGAVLVGFAVLLGHALRLEHEPWWRHSALLPYAEHVAAAIEDFTGGPRELTRRPLTVPVGNGGG